MNAVRDRVVAQFRKPSGVLGQLAGYIMAHRASNRQRNAWTVELLELRPGQSVLEIGCGPGVALAACAQLVTDSGSVVGIDHSSVMLGQARARLHRQSSGVSCVLRLGGVELIAEWPQSFDRVFSVNVVQFLPDLEGACASIHAALKKGGTAATTYQPRHRAPTRQDALAKAAEIEAAMRGAGFAEIRTDMLEIRPVPAVCVRGVRG